MTKKALNRWYAVDVVRVEYGMMLTVEMEVELEARAAMLPGTKSSKFLVVNIFNLHFVRRVQHTMLFRAGHASSFYTPC